MKKSQRLENFYAPAGGGDEPEAAAFSYATFLSSCFIKYISSGVQSSRDW